MPKDKNTIRIYELARELDMESKALIDLCRQAGVDLRNQLSSVDADVRDQIVALVKKGASQQTATQARSPIPVPDPDKKVRNLQTPSRPRTPGTPEVSVPATVTPTSTPVSTPTPPVAVVTPVVAAVPASIKTPVPSAVLTEKKTEPPRRVVEPTPRAEETNPTESVKIVQTTTEKAAEKRAEKVVETTTEKTAIELAIAKVVEKGIEKAAVKVDEKPAEKVVEKPAATVTPATPTPTTPAQQRPAQPVRPLGNQVRNLGQRNQGQVRDMNTRQGQGGQRPGQGGQSTEGQTTGGQTGGQQTTGAQTTGNQQGNQNTGGQRPAQGGNQQGGQRPGQGGTTQGGNQQGGQRPGQGGTTQQGGNRQVGQRPGQGGTTQGGNQQGGNRTGQPQNRKPGEKEPEQKGPKKIGNLPAELHGRSSVTIEDLIRKQREQTRGPIQPTPTTQQQAASVGGEDIPETEEDRPGNRKPGAAGAGTGTGDKRKGSETAGRGIPGRDQRHKDRQRQRGDGGVVVRAGQAVIDEENVRSRRHKKQPQKKIPITLARKGKVPIAKPITVRSLSEAIGKRSSELILKLMTLGVAGININSVLDPELSETIALDYGCELDIKSDLDAEQKLDVDSDRPDAVEDLILRAPVVTIMGHVDHGKTTLLDKIRKSNVAGGEIGGITQVIRAWRVDHGGRPITFLDTPGHEAFTKMRARGANVTDIVVIVVAVNDGVMPQTEEAVAHAKAAGVSIIVALNKVDLPDANIKKTEQQLYGLGLIPDTMGGEVQFVQVSGKTGKGIDELLDTISLVAELKELKANPEKPARGTCLEAHLDPDEGVFATILVRDGTLKKGDTIVCGGTFGRVRAMYNDLGRSIHEAGPTVPVRITGLDAVPQADDPFHVVEDVTVAREVAEKRMNRAADSAMTRRTALTLESLGEAKVTELKVILKAEARGSIEAIRAELSKLTHAEVRVRLLHAAIGGITESDVQLALTSPDDTIIVGFNVVADDRAKTLADDRGIQVRLYDIIYKLTDDIKSALEGKLKPREEIVFLGRASVRKVFKITKVGTIAGCFVTKGVIERSAKVRVIRSGIVVYPPAERTVGLESLKRVKDDAREVKEGTECGIKVAGYDDIKVEDVIEAYRIEQVLRTL